LSAVDDTHTTRAFFIVAHENITFHGVIVAMAQYHISLRFLEYIVAYHIAARFNGNDLGLPVAAVKKIIHDLRIGIELAMLRNTHTDDLTGIGAQRWTNSKIIVVDGMEVLTASFIIQYNGHQHTEIFFIEEAAMIDAVLFAGKGNPVIFRHPFRFVEIVDDAIGETAIIGQLLIIDPEIDYGPRRRITVGEAKAVDGDVIAAEPQLRSAADDHFAGLLRFKNNGLPFFSGTT
jgi:hypothetical protein